MKKRERGGGRYCLELSGELIGDGQWIPGSLNPMQAATFGFLGQMLRGSGNSLELATKLLHQLTPAGGIHPNPFQDRRKMTGDTAAFVATKLAPGPVQSSNSIRARPMISDERA